MQLGAKHRQSRENMNWYVRTRMPSGRPKPPKTISTNSNGCFFSFENIQIHIVNSYVTLTQT